MPATKGDLARLLRDEIRRLDKRVIKRDFDLLTYSELYHILYLLTAAATVLEKETPRELQTLED